MGLWITIWYCVRVVKRDCRRLRPVRRWASPFHLIWHGATSGLAKISGTIVAHMSTCVARSLHCSCGRYVEGMRKRKLQGGKQDIAGTKEEDPRTKDWIIELNAASRALALRWLRAARDGLDGELSIVPASRMFSPNPVGTCALPIWYVEGFHT